MVHSLKWAINNVHHASNPKSACVAWQTICTRIDRGHLTACWHDSLGWGSHDPFSAWRSDKPFKLPHYWMAKTQHVGQGSRLQIKSDCGRSDSTLFAGQDFQGLTFQIWGHWTATGSFKTLQPLTYRLWDLLTQLTAYDECMLPMQVCSLHNSVNATTIYVCIWNYL